LERYEDKKRIIPILANSLGCMEKKGNLYHDRDPLSTTPKKRTPNNIKIEKE
jgi:hypothetical protein